MKGLIVRLVVGNGGNLVGCAVKNLVVVDILEVLPSN